MAMNKGQGQGKQRISNTQKKLESLRNVAPARLHAAFLMTGNVNSVTAFGKFNQGTIDIFAQAAAIATRTSENAYNNWLASGAKPVADVYHKAVGLYIGERFPGILPIKAILAEHSSLIIQQSNGAKVMKQPTLTIPPGLGVEGRYATADATGTDKKLQETFGPMSPVGLFTVPADLKWKEDAQLQGLLTIETAAMAEIMAISTALPASGFIIAIEVYGEMALKVGTTR